MIKQDWFHEQLILDDIYVSPVEIQDIIDGRNLKMYEPGVIDYVLELETEWNSQHTS